MESFSWFLMLPFVHGNHDLDAVVGAWVVFGLITILAFIARGQLKAATARGGVEQYIPDDKLTIRNIFELVSELNLGLMRNMMGDAAHRFFPLVGSIFIYVILCNLMGILPGFLPPTENINTNAAVAIVVFLVYNAAGIKAQGLGNYLKHFLGPVAWLAPLMVVVEIISHLVRPASLAIRLFGNINGDHIVLSIFSSLLPGEQAFDFMPLAFGIPIPFLGLGMFVSFMQAFVFALLTSVYISMAIAHEEH